MELILGENRGIGKIHVGMNKEDIRTILNSQYIPLDTSNEYSRGPGDEFPQSGFFTYYNEQDICEAIEAYDESCLRYKEHDLFTSPFSELLECFKKLDATLETNTDGFTSFKLGMGIYCPSHMEEPSSKIEGTILFRDGYYD